jgi:WD40 repeat protein
MSKGLTSRHSDAHARTLQSGTLPFITVLMDDQRQRWRRGEAAFVERYLESMASLQEDREGLLDLICNEVVLRAERGEVPQLGEYLHRFEPYQEKFPDLATQIRVLFEVEGVIQTDSVSTSVDVPPTNVGSLLGPKPVVSRPPPERMVGRYEIIGELGRGAMGVVYRARQAGLNRIVALKMVLSGDYAGPDDLVRFRSEAEAVARLQHPHIVQIYEVGEQDNLPYFSLEYVSGGNLAKKLSGFPLPAREAAKLTETLARAVHYAHQRGVIHRDLKPANVLLTEDGEPKITDFGLAKRLQTEADSESPLPETKSGDIMGTPSYMAPEQALGKTELIGPLTDVYALGAILYEMLTGRPPFRGANTVETLHQVVFDELVPPSSLQPKLPRDLETICLMSLHKDAKRRYASAEAMADDLRRFLNGETIRARRTSVWERGYKFAMRRPAWALIIAATPLVCAGLGVLALYALDKEQKERAALRQAQVAEDRAKENELDARREAYRAQMKTAWDEWQNTHVRLASINLDKLKPTRTDQRDLRGFEWYYLDKLRHADLRTIPGAHTTVCLSPDGLTVAAAGPGNTAKIWDIGKGEEIHTFAGHEGPVQTLAFHPRGDLLVTGSEDQTLRIWDVASGRLLHTVRDHKGAVNCVAFRPDGERLVSAGNDGRVIIWNAADGNKVTIFNGHTQAVYAIAYRPDGKLLASAGADGNVLVWGEDRKIVTQLPGEQDEPITALAFSRDGQRIVTGSVKGNLTLWTLSDNQDPHPQSLREAHKEAVKGLAFSADGGFFASASLDQTIRLWDGRDGKDVSFYRGHLAGVTAVAFSPRGLLLASAGEDPAVKIWDASVDPEAVILHGENPHSALVHSIGFSPNGTHIASASFDKRVKIWDAATGEELRSFDAHNDMVNSVAYSPDGKHLATAGADRLIKIRNLEADEAPVILDGHTDSVECVAYSPNGGWLVSGSKDGTVRLWDLGTHNSGRILGRHLAGVICVAVTPDGRRIASGGEDRTVRVWEAETGSEIFRLTDHSDTVTSVAFSPDGQFLASGGHDWTAKIWNAKTGELIHSLSGHERAVQGVVFGPDSEHLITVSSDRLIKFWDVPSGQETFTLPGDPNWVATTCVAMSRDGKRLAWGGGRTTRQGEVRLLDARPGSIESVGRE